MNDFEALEVTIQTTQLRLNQGYQDAYKLIRGLGPDELARTARLAANDSGEHAAVRLLAGTWERIAIFVKDFNPEQRSRFFKCHPVALMWDRLQPAIQVIRNESGGAFAKEFEDLKQAYAGWAESAQGQGFSTAQQQVICALFA